MGIGFRTGADSGDKGDIEEKTDSEYDRRRGKVRMK